MQAAIALASNGAVAMVAALRSGRAIPFHSSHYPRGHAPSDAEAWCHEVLGDREPGETSGGGKVNL